MIAQSEWNSPLCSC